MDDLKYSMEGREGKGFGWFVGVCLFVCLFVGVRLGEWIRLDWCVDWWVAEWPINGKLES